MTELEKMRSGAAYCFDDPEVDALKLHAVKGCQKLESIDVLNQEAKRAAMRELFGHVGRDANILPGFICDNGRNISIGDNFIANYNVTILDCAPVTIGDNVMIGPNTSIITVNHPLTPAGRRAHLATCKPVTIGNDVWLAAGVTVLPGVTIGNNVVVAAGAVVTHDVPSNTLVAGVPARPIRSLQDDAQP